MKIAVLEWICCGGMHAIPIEEIPDSLLCEGRAMLLCLIEQFAAAGNHVSTMVDSRLNLGEVTLPESVELVDFSALTSRATNHDAIDETISKWKQLSKSCDLSIVIAPEIDGILQRCVDSMIEDGLPLINCSGAFLDNSASKLRTAMRLTQHGLPTPPSISADKLEPSCFRSAQFDSATGLWCVKPDLGAGCDGLHIGDANEILKVVQQLQSKADWIVQPWLEGQSFSCSAIVDSHGRADWFPLVTQQLKSAPFRGQTTTRQYCGGQLVSLEKLHPPVELLNETLRVLNEAESGRALGWVGVDLLLRPDLQDHESQWVVIEVNPRLTTSIIGLSKASTTNLAQRMIDAFQGQECPRLLQSQWSEVEFSPTSA